MGLANATAYDPAETAMVFGHYAAKFWSGVHGDRADPEPKCVGAAQGVRRAKGHGS